MYVKPVASKGRGAISNASGRYETHTIHAVHDGWYADSHPNAHTKSHTNVHSDAHEDVHEDVHDEILPGSSMRTHWQDDTSKTVITRNRSPDIHFDRSINPYRGCEHGCVYCFARPTHTWLGHSAGLDFETRRNTRPT